MYMKIPTLLTVAKCGTTSVTINAVVNFSKKLQLNQLKCAKIHVGKKCDDGPKLFVHKELVKSSNKEKCFGDIGNRDGKQHVTVAE